MTRQSRCPICARRFTPRKGWQIYDRPECRREGYKQRQINKIIAEYEASKKP